MTRSSSTPAPENPLDLDKNDSSTLEELIAELGKEDNENREISLKPSSQKIKVSKSLQDELNRVRVADVRTKVITRIVLTVFFLVLLSAQNYFLFQVIQETLKLNNIEKLQPVLGVITAATLGETYFIVKEIVHKTFESNDYSATDKE